MALVDVAYGDGNGTWVVVGRPASILTSGDGNNWSNVTLKVEVSSFADVAYGNGRWVAVGDSGTIIYSDDGNTWNRGSSTGTTDMIGVAYGGGIWVAVGADASILYSADNGENWSAAGTVPVTGENLHSVVYGNGLWIAVGQDGVVLKSTDGDTWSEASSTTSSDLQSIVFVPELTL